MIPRDSHCGGVPYGTRHVASECGPAPFRKQRLAKMLARGGVAITYNEHLNHDGPKVFEHACRLGLEGIVSKRLDAPYRSGPSKTWLKSKNPLSEAVRREREEEWELRLPAQSTAPAFAAGDESRGGVPCRAAAW